MNAVVHTLLADFGSDVTPRPSSDHMAYDVTESALLKAIEHLKLQAGFEVLADLTAIDHGVEAHPRFSTVYHLLSTHYATYVRLVCALQSDTEPKCPSITALYPAADWHEREAYDMFGIIFTGHPELKRILMWGGYPYHPLRKDFPLAGIETELPAADTAEATHAKVIAAPMAGGPFVAGHGEYLSHSEPGALDQSWTETHPKPS